MIEEYIDAVRRNEASALPPHPDAVCEFPMNTYRGAAEFHQGLDEFARIMKSIDVTGLLSMGTAAPRKRGAVLIVSAKRLSFAGIGSESARTLYRSASS